MLTASTDRISIPAREGPFPRSPGCARQDSRGGILFSRNRSVKLRLFCFPYAGGGASVFSAWNRLLPAQVDVCALQMPGREERIAEPPLVSWGEAVECALRELMPYMDRPFALFGHSLGATLAFECTRRLRHTRPAGCLHLFASGRSAPHLPLDRPLTYDLPDEDFIAELRRLAGTPEEVLAEPELMEALLPVLRADFCLSQTYSHQPVTPLAIPISAYGGLDDEDVPAPKLDAWRAHTTAAFRRSMFPGSHFFLNEHPRLLLSRLSGELEEVLAGS